MHQAIPRSGELLFTVILTEWKMTWNDLIKFNKGKCNFLTGTGATILCLGVRWEKKRHLLRKGPEWLSGQWVEQDLVACVGRKHNQLCSVLPGVEPTLEGSGDSHALKHLQDCTGGTVCSFLYSSARMTLTCWSKFIKGHIVMGLRYFSHEDRIRNLDLFKFKNSRLKGDFAKVYNYLA